MQQGLTVLLWTDLYSDKSLRSEQVVEIRFQSSTCHATYQQGHVLVDKLHFWGSLVVTMIVDKPIFS